jgi:chorismate mutase/prephenate dehydratase
MALTGRTLDALRREIDRIDDEIHDLLMRRAEVVDEIRRSKGGRNGPYLRPGREAAILRRLLGRHEGNFPKVALVRIWREIIAALTQLQGPFSVAVFAPPDYPGYWDLARDHFGSTTPMIRHVSVDHVVRAASESPDTIGVLPYPHEASEDPWWRHLASEEPDALRIVARLPFAGQMSGRGENVTAMAIARMDPEPTGRDRSLFAVETANEVSRSHFISAMKKAGLDPRFVGEWRGGGGGAPFLHLVEVTDFVTTSDPRFETLREWQDGAIVRIIPVGGYAEPLGEAELAESIARRA